MEITWLGILSIAILIFTGYCGYRKSIDSWCAGFKHPSEGYGESNSFYGIKMHRCIR